MKGGMGGRGAEGVPGEGDCEEEIGGGVGAAGTGGGGGQQGRGWWGAVD